MTLQFSTTTKLSVTNGVKMLVHARAGTGKTMLCATAPKPIILSAESGLLSLSEQNQQRVFGRVVDIPVIVIKTYADIDAAYDWLTTSPHAQQFETICLDSLTEIAETVLSNEKALVRDARQAYGEMNEKTINLVKKFRDLPGKHVYMSAKQGKSLDESSGVSLLGAKMPGKELTHKLPFEFDEVFNLNVAKTPEGVDYRYLQTQPDLQYDAKDRSGALDAIEQPNLSNIISKIININKS